MRNIYKILTALAFGAASLGFNTAASAGENHSRQYAYHDHHSAYPGERHYYRPHAYSYDYGHGRHAHKHHRHHKQRLYKKVKRHHRHYHSRGHRHDRRHNDYDHGGHRSRHDDGHQRSDRRERRHDRKVTHTARAQSHRF